MEKTATLANRLKEVLTEGKWITGTNYKEQIKGMDWKDAIVSVDGLNSVAKLTFHINYYLDGVAKVLEGGTLDISDKYSFDAPLIESQKDWDGLVCKFCQNAERFIKLVYEMREEKLLACFVEKKYGSYWRNIDVMIEHSYYHLGQIVLIKKLINTRNANTNNIE